MQFEDEMVRLHPRVKKDEVWTKFDKEFSKSFKAKVSILIK